ncbi:MAG: MaoC/PaaZ C-terminal domain-containing protein [Rhizomicrobium sp.]
MTIEELLRLEQARLGVEVGPSRWRDVRQEDINAFAVCTDDPDPMHIDVAWAKRYSPFGGTIAFGFWTIAMLTTLLGELSRMSHRPSLPHEELIGINYGCDRLRLIEPVRVGARIRARATLVSVEQPAPDRILRRTDVTVDVENASRPALVARWLSVSLMPEKGVRLDGFRRANA